MVVEGELHEEQEERKEKKRRYKAVGKYSLFLTTQKNSNHPLHQAIAFLTCAFPDLPRTKVSNPEIKCG